MNCSALIHRNNSKSLHTFRSFKYFTYYTRTFISCLKAISAKTKSLGGIDETELPAPRLEHSTLQATLVARGQEHKERDRRRQRSEDTSAYVNGVLFGFDPDRPLEDQVDGWKSAVEPVPEQLAELGLAGKAWLKKEQRQMGGDQ